MRLPLLADRLPGGLALPDVDAPGPICQLFALKRVLERSLLVPYIYIITYMSTQT